MGLKDMAFISGLNVVSPVFGQCSSNDEQVFRNRLFPDDRQISYQGINQAISTDKFIKQVNVGMRGLRCQI